MNTQSNESSECCGGNCACKDEVATEGVRHESHVEIRTAVRERYASAAEISSIS